MFQQVGVSVSGLLLLLRLPGRSLASSLVSSSAVLCGKCYHYKTLKIVNTASQIFKEGRFVTAPGI